MSIPLGSRLAKIIGAGVGGWSRCSENIDPGISAQSHHRCDNVYPWSNALLRLTSAITPGRTEEEHPDENGSVSVCIAADGAP
jgi:hypothetical protein